MPQYSGIWTEQAVMQAVGAGNWANVPGVPTGVTGTVLGATSVSVAFTAPTFAGIPATITSYTVTSSPGGITASGASSPITVTGLTTGTPYTFTVTATNASGTSSPSAASSSVTPVQIDYIEDVFSTYLYTGTDTTSTGVLSINNSIDLASKGGLVWIKSRSQATSNAFFDTSRGTNQLLVSNSTGAQSNEAPYTLGAFNSNGFSIGSASLGSYALVNALGATFASWTFRKQAKFFDMVTYTGTGSVQNIAHNLGSVPGCIIVKRTDTTSNWVVYHRSLNTTSGGLIALNLSFGELSDVNAFNSTVPTSTVFTVGSSSSTNGSGGTFVAYIFAHNAGGFGLSGSDNVITCGSFTASAGQTTVTLGYEPQWILIKESSASGDNWKIWDTMRGWSQTTYSELYPNTSAAQAAGSGTYTYPTATGFVSEAGWLTSGRTYIYIAIRRGPMKVPTSGTSVFAPVAVTVPPYSITAGFPVDFVLFGKRSGANSNRWLDLDRLRGGQPALLTSSTASENNTYASSFASNTQFTDGWSSSGYANVYECFQRAPGFFDEVCYTGTNSGGSSQTIPHNLGVAPELTIFKKRAAVSNWTVAMPAIGGNAVSLNLNDVGASSNIQFIDTYGASSITTASGYDTISENTTTYVAYFFATCAGVSKVGSYTGTGALLTVNCGFAAGARFVLIKRIDSTGDWYTYDSARGISSSSDPYLLLNSTAAEVTGTNYVDTTSVGFQVTAAAPAGLNASGGTYIFLAIA